MKNGIWFKVFDDTTGKIEKIVKSRIEGCEYADKVDPKCERLHIRVYKYEYDGYVIERHEYPHLKYKWQFLPIEYDGEDIGLGETVKDCKTQIDELNE